MEFIKKIYRCVKNTNTNSAIYNLNYNQLSDQKKLAFVYREKVFLDRFNINDIRHVNILHQYQMLNTFLKLGYCIDIYRCDVHTPSLLKKNYYDLILGFGENYLSLCQLNPSALKVLFVTENAPWIVKENFSKRIEYYKERHGKIPFTITRMQFYNDEMFKISDIGIIMNGKYNYSSMQEVFSKSYKISVNALFNPNVNYLPKKDFSKIRNNFLWFGSNGLIHKGLDILIDAFRQIPECTLNVYGAPEKEFKAFKITKNIIFHKSINVYSDDFIKNVINNNSFTLSLSCSEAMMSGIATCMVHGIIPITTIETGFDDFSDGIIFKSFKTEDVVQKIKTVSKYDKDFLYSLSQKTFDYSRNEYSLQNFSKRFEIIMSDINKNIL